MRRRLLREGKQSYQVEAEEQSARFKSDLFRLTKRVSLKKLGLRGKDLDREVQVEVSRYWSDYLIPGKEGPSIEAMQKSIAEAGAGDADIAEALANLMPGHLSEGIEATQSSDKSGPDACSPKRPSRSWEALTGDYVMKVYHSGQYATALALYKDLFKKATDPQSPFAQGREGVLTVKATSRLLQSHTVENRFAEIRAGTFGQGT